MKRASPGKAILIGGLIAGALDIIYAFLFYGWKYGISPLRILQSVASGLLGRASRDGGLATGALGLFLQFVIAIGAAATCSAGIFRSCAGIPWPPESSSASSSTA
jgi:hypothetical protein